MQSLYIPFFQLNRCKTSILKDGKHSTHLTFQSCLCFNSMPLLDITYIMVDNYETKLH